MDWCGFLILKTNDLWKISTRESQTIWKDIRQFTASNSLQPRRCGKERENAPNPRGKSNNQTMFFEGLKKKKKKKGPRSGDRQPGCNKCPGNPYRTQPVRISDPASLFSPAAASWQAGAVDGGEAVPHAARSHAATHPSPSALATAAVAGWLRAGIREGWRALAPEDADMWQEAPLP